MKLAANCGLCDLLISKAAGIASRFAFRLPDRLLALLAGRPPSVARELAPDAWLLARLTSSSEDGGSAAPTVRSRRMYDLLGDAVAARERSGALTFDRTIAGPAGPVPVRIYRPDPFDGSDGSGGRSGRLPGILYLHGGGWANGSLLSHDRTCRRLARLAGAVVVAVDYRLSPENQWPAGLDDALAAWRDIAARPSMYGVDPSRMGIAGDSAGGNLAAAACIALRQAGEGQPLFQLLLYPALDLVERHPSADSFGQGFRLTDADMDAYKDLYVPPGPKRHDPLVSPLLADDLSGLAPAHVFTALADPLRDEGEFYVRRLRESGVEATLDRIPSIHGWFNMTVMRSSRSGFDQVVSRLRHTFTIAG